MGALRAMSSGERFVISTIDSLMYDLFTDAMGGEPRRSVERLQAILAEGVADRTQRRFLSLLLAEHQGIAKDVDGARKTIKMIRGEYGVDADVALQLARVLLHDQSFDVETSGAASEGLRLAHNAWHYHDGHQILASISARTNDAAGIERHLRASLEMPYDESMGLGPQVALAGRLVREGRMAASASAYLRLAAAWVAAHGPVRLSAEIADLLQGNKNS